MRSAKIAVAALLLALFAAPSACNTLFAQSRGAGRATAALPERLSDSLFWKTISDVSEPGGTFQSENWTSNEMQVHNLVGQLRNRVPSGGVYVGVGPEQNYSYIAGMRPRVAFIVDIRRQNMILHLMYKAAMELSETRADFLARLFSRERPPGLDTASSAANLLDAISAATTTPDLFARNLRELREWLTGRHGFGMSETDTAILRYVYGTFHRAGTSINYSYRPEAITRATATTFARLLAPASGDAGNNGFLASEDSYRFLRDMHLRNLIIPVVGDFAGEKALRAVGRFLADRGALVTAFYVSNVENYLWREVGAWPRFIANVEALPLDSAAIFIRPNGFAVATMLLQAATAVDSAAGAAAPPARIITGVPVNRETARNVFSNIPRTIQAFKEGLIKNQQEAMRIGG